MIIELIGRGFLVSNKAQTVNTFVWNDEWPAYNNLNAMGYNHLTVNHQRHYVDPVTGAHTQAIK
uniref:ISXO2-like transposase domain-containing protein n=1 Tax=Octopus bimaculoides TaxID=37653 RepID=A0A0L8FY64_OCTBM